MTDIISKKVARTCDECKARKVRCLKSGAEAQSPCRNCVARNAPCHFSYLKQPRKRKIIPEGGSTVGARNPVPLSGTCDVPTSQDSRANRNEKTVSGGSHYGRKDLCLTSHIGQIKHQFLSPLYIDLLLADCRAPAAHKNETSSTKLTEIFGHSSNLSFFSTSRVRSLNSRLGHTKLNQLMHRIDSVLSSRLNKSPSQMTQLYSLRQSDRVPPSIAGPLTASYIRSYFEQVHPIYPFLERQSFEKRAFEPMSQSSVTVDEVWSALYHTVLAIGCQYNDGGSFDPGCGQAWKLFEVALSYFPDIVMMKGSLMAVQALTAMAIFSSTVSAYHFESLLVTEAAKLSQSMGYNKITSTIPNPNENERRRVFWVVYCLEKSSCFITGRASTLMDSDIGCPIPYVSESTFGSYNWLLSFARYARLVSRIYSSLFSVSSGEHTASTYHTSIRQLNDELEAWRVSIPLQYRPREQLSGRGLPGTLEIFIAVSTQYLYFNALLTLLRISLHVGVGDMATAPDQQETKKQLMKTACLILDLTKYIEVAPYASMWIMALMPISALFILFDLVVHNPTHPETNNNLALLDVASGHFGRIEYASRGTLPGSLVSEFAHIAREYVRGVQRERLPKSRHNENNNKQHENIDLTSSPLIQSKEAVTNYNGISSEQYLQQTPRCEILGQVISGSGSHISQPIDAIKVPPETPTSMPFTAPPEQKNQLLNAQQLPTTYSAPHHPFVMHNQAVSTRSEAETETIFFPLVDDPTYLIPGDEEMQQLLGIDVMDLFDFANSSASGLDRR
ncbi:fungal-specific transcription factor domain-containing protein [Talaromyces proteolyticus]|uniref:Fungal-specific transcription factor domain-containing protein n=1 Tax=Talaromyces proteolyticus TaxID=1131652 RepID=A0AAD4KPG1_9EURO|nr:fungal-specific transcription factor domain-containing protein [Talaromyces proteolyticus]KAH8695318.1 fungal-specific transcription factor domain-containing protein [Talaromyces proteolyticus]